MNTLPQNHNPQGRSETDMSTMLSYQIYFLDDEYRTRLASIYFLKKTNDIKFFKTKLENIMKDMQYYM